MTTDELYLLDIGLKLCTDCGYINPPMEYDAHGPHCRFRHVLLVIQSEAYLDAENDQLRARLHQSEQTIIDQQETMVALRAELEQARAWIQPFIPVAGDIPADCSDDDKVHFWRSYWLSEDITVGHFRLAAVYQQSKPAQQTAADFDAPDQSAEPLFNGRGEVVE